jgi:hypothetical protein
MSEKSRNTVAMLKRLRAAKEAGANVAYRTDVDWLEHMAINRRAGWPDDPGFSYGSAMPVNGRYPVRYGDDRYRHLRLLAHQINTPRLIVRVSELGEWRALLTARLPSRFTYPGED